MIRLPGLVFNEFATHGTGRVPDQPLICSIELEI